MFLSMRRRNADKIQVKRLIPNFREIMSWHLQRNSRFKSQVLNEDSNNKNLTEKKKQNISGQISVKNQYKNPVQKFDGLPSLILIIVMCGLY